MMADIWMPWETWRKAVKRQKHKRNKVSAGWMTSGQVSLKQQQQVDRQKRETETER